MSNSTAGYDYDRYRRMLAEATDEPRRLALIRALIDEGARAKLAAQRRAPDRPARSGGRDA